MTGNYLTIKEINEKNRPMEKLFMYGADSLSNSELLAILIGTGIKGKNAIDLARNLLDDLEGEKALLYKSIENLMEIEGIGFSKACRIKASLELGKRLGKIDRFDKISFNSPETVANYLYKYYMDSTKEEFIVFLLDTKNKLIAVESISIGTINKTIVHPRDVFRKAIARNSTSLILAHNHPSGDPTPSDEDINMTNKLFNIGELIGISILDHIIVGNNKFVSLREKKLIRGYI